MKKKFLSLFLMAVVAATQFATAQELDPNGGTKDNPFRISTKEQMCSLIKYVKSGEVNYIVLEADIDMAGVTDWTPLFNNGGSYPYFDFDGQNHVISNLTSDLPGAYDYPGLFGVLCGSVRNLGIENANVTSTGGTGIIAGYLGHSTFSQPSYMENVWVTGKLHATGYCGGMIGNIGGESYITNCYVNVEVTGESDLTGGIIGRIRGKLDMKQVYAAGSINRGGGVIGGGQNSSTPPCSYSDIVVWNNTAKNFGPLAAEDALTDVVYYDGSNFATLQSVVLAWGKPWASVGENEYPTLGTDVAPAGPDMVDGYYLVASAEDLNWVNEKILGGETGLNVRLTADIDLSTSGYPNLMIGAETAEYCGIFDGDGHTVTYHYENVADKWRGLFAFVNGATIRNLRVEGSAYVTQIHYGALIGRAYGTVLVENVVTNVDITGAMNQVTGAGGMLGANYADITFNNCATMGKMGYPGSSMYSSFSAWSNGSSSTTLNNCYSTCSLTEGTGTGNCFTLTHQSGTININNSYYLNAIGTIVGGTQVTAEQIASGELCYLLNGDQEVISWTQTIGTDAAPQPNTNSKTVYAIGSLRCDGAVLPDAPIVYTNEFGCVTIPAHQYGADGFCTVCGSVEQDGNGCYLVDNAKKFNWLVEKVASGTGNLNVLLNANIDLTESGNLMIGTEPSPFKGVFDGQGHTVTYKYENVADKWRGLFAFVNGATIRNLIVKGSAVVTNIHYGALIGYAAGNVLVENVITDVDITGKSTTGVQGDAGMLGANYANITFNNCATLGAMGGEGTSMYSSFSAWSNGSSSTTLNNCFSACKLKEGTGEGNCFTLTHQSGKNTFNNSYYVYQMGVAKGGTQVTAEQMAGGELAYLLGGVWRQNIGEDAVPVLDPAHGIVNHIGSTGFATMYLPTTSVSIPTGVTASTAVVNEPWVTTTPIQSSLISAGTPVVLQGAEGFYSFVPVNATTDAVENDLKGTAEPLEANGSQYVLASKDGVVGFYQATGTIPAGKAYIEKAGAGVKGFFFGGADGIAEVETGNDSDAAIFDLSGRRVVKAQKGIYIINGKKVLK